MQIATTIMQPVYYAHGNVGKARTLAIRLLREQVSWTGKEIGEYMGIKMKSIYDSVNKIKKREDLRKDYEWINKV